MTIFECKFCDILCIRTQKIGIGLGRLTLGHFGGHRCTVHQPPKQAIIKKFRLFILLFRQEGFYSLVQSSGWRDMDSKMLGTMKAEGGSFSFPTMIGCAIHHYLSSPDSTPQKKNLNRYLPCCFAFCQTSLCLFEVAHSLSTQLIQGQTHLKILKCN